MATQFTATYKVKLCAAYKNHAKQTNVEATLERLTPTNMPTVGVTVDSATIDMGTTTFWSGSENRPYLDFGTVGRVSVPNTITDKSALPITTPTADFDLNYLLSVGDPEEHMIYGTKSTSGNVVTYPSTDAEFIITASCTQYYTKSTASITSSVAAGTASTVTFANSSLTSVYHVVTWSFGSSSKSSTTAVGAASVSYTIPLSWLTNIPNATSGSASVQVTTYSSDGTSLGSNSYTFTITAPTTAVPSLSVTLERINNTVPSTWSIYVQGKSGVKLTATASGYQGSTIKSYAISGGATGSQSTNVFTINPITGSGSITYTIKVTDSRGRTAQVEKTITVAAYTPPVFTEATAFRCTSNGTASEEGKYARVKANGTFDSMGGLNTCTLTAKYGVSGSSTYSTATTLTKGTASTIGANKLDANTSYTILFALTDTFGAVEKTVNLSTAAYTVFFREGGNAVAIGKVSEHDNALEINGDWAIYHGTDRLDGTVPISRGGTGATTADAALAALGALKKSGGDTMTGDLIINNTLYPSVKLLPTNAGQTNNIVFEGSYAGAASFAIWEDATGNNRRMLEVRSATLQSDMNNAVLLRVAVNGTWSTYRLFHTGMTTGIPLGFGGTGAKNAADARSNLGCNNASNLTTGTVPMARMPMKMACGSTSVNSNTSGVAYIDYSSAGFTNVPCVTVTYSTTAANWTGDNGSLKVYSKTTTGAYIIVGGSFGTSRNIDWIAMGT